MADSIYYQLNRYVPPVLIIFGTIGAIINQILFYYRKPLRISSCSLYFRALSANDLLVLYLYVLLQWLTNQYGFDPTKQYNWYCKLKTLLNTSLYTLSPYLVVLACFDRLCTSSTNVRLRRIATIRTASIIIPCAVIFVFLSYFHVPIWYQLVHTPTTSTCNIVNPLYTIVFAIFLIIYLGFMPPLLMIILCSITLILIRQQRRRIMPVNQTRLRQRDNQILKMLFFYVISHLICTIPFSILLLIVVYEYPSPSATSVLLLRLFLLLFNVNFSTSFYIYTLGTPFYRQELWNLIKNIHHRMNRIIHPNRIHTIFHNPDEQHSRRT